MSTIFALSSVAGKSAVALVRISGPQSRLILSRLSSPSKSTIIPRHASVRFLRHPTTSEILDKALTLFFYGPATFTGEDTCELHLHGSKAVIKSVLDAIPLCHPTIRYAEPGEFSKRAFYNGKMDLTQAEGLADLIDSETDEQRRSAFRQAEGSLSRLYAGWRAQLVEMRSQLEAIIDFGEDNDGIEEGIYEEVLITAEGLRSEMQRHLKSSLKGELLRSGIKVAIFGPPNAGKSSLLNILAQRDASIVSPIAGTTRDVVETILDIGGFPVIVGDTAGLREGDSVDVVEQEGVKRAKNRIQEANLRICVVPYGSTIDGPTKAELDLYSKQAGNRDSIILLLNKVDMLNSPSIPSKSAIARDTNVPETQIIEISCTTGQGLDPFLGLFVNKLRDLTSGGTNEDTASLGINARHRDQMKRCLLHIDAFMCKWQ